MADISVQAKYMIVNYDTAKCLEEGDAIDSITYYNDDLGKNITLSEVSVLNISEYNVEVVDDGYNFHNIDIESIVDFDC